MSNTIERVNECFEKFKDHFETGLHNALWEILVNNIHDGKLVCFVTSYTEHGQILGLAYANERGYMPTGAYFKSMPYAQSEEIATQLNRIAFDLTKEEALRMAITTMREPNF